MGSFQAFGNATGFTNSYFRFGGNVMTGIGIDTREEVDGYEELLGKAFPQSFSLGGNIVFLIRLM